MLPKLNAELAEDLETGPQFRFQLTHLKRLDGKLLAEQVEGGSSALTTIVKSSGGQTIDPYDFLCSSSGCPIVLGGKPTHIDADHLRAFYVMQRATFVKGLLSQ